MSKEEKLFEMMKAIAPTFVSKGIELQERLYLKSCKRKIQKDKKLYF